MYATKTENSYSIALICTNVIKRTLKQYEIFHNDDISLDERILSYISKGSPDHVGSLSSPTADTHSDCCFSMYNIEIQTSHHN